MLSASSAVTLLPQSAAGSLAQAGRSKKIQGMADSEVILYRRIDKEVCIGLRQERHHNNRKDTTASGNAVHVTTVTIGVIIGIRARKFAICHVLRVIHLVRLLHCMSCVFTIHSKPRHVLRTMLILDGGGNTNDRYAQRKPEDNEVS